MTTTIQNLAHLLDAELTSLEDVELLPVGAGVVDDDGMLWQLDWPGWFPANGVAEQPRTAASLLRYSPTLLLKWLPPEAMGQ